MKNVNVFAYVAVEVILEVELISRFLPILELSYRIILPFFHLIIFVIDPEKAIEKRENPDNMGMRKKGTASPDVSTIVPNVRDEVITINEMFWTLFSKLYLDLLF